MLLSGLLEHLAPSFANRCIHSAKACPWGYVVNAAMHPLLVVLLRKCGQPDVCDLSVRQAFYALLDKGEYLASESTVYRILRHY